MADNRDFTNTLIGWCKQMDKKDTPQKVIVIAAFLIMLLFTMFSILRPMNGQNITKISASYPNLITPPDYTFMIWWFIYLLFTAFLVYQLDLFGHKRFIIRPEALYYTRIVFIGFCALNMIWEVAWQYDYIALATLILFIMVICMRFLCKYLSREDMSDREKVLIKLPFSLLYGWLTILTISSFAILLVSIRWKAFGIPIMFWTAIALTVLAVYAVIRTLRNKDLPYCLTILWGYTGILVQHTLKDKLNGQYPLIIAAAIFGIIILAGSAGVLLYKKKRIR